MLYPSVVIVVSRLSDKALYNFRETLHTGDSSLWFRDRELYDLISSGIQMEDIVTKIITSKQSYFVNSFNPLFLNFFKKDFAKDHFFEDVRGLLVKYFIAPIRLEKLTTMSPGDVVVSDQKIDYRTRFREVLIRSHLEETCVQETFTSKTAAIKKSTPYQSFG